MDCGRRIVDFFYQNETQGHITSILLSLLFKIAINSVNLFFIYNCLDLLIGFVKENLGKMVNNNTRKLRLLAGIKVFLLHLETY